MPRLPRRVDELGIALAARGHEVHFVTYAQPFRLPSFLPRVYFHEVDVGRYPLFEYPPYDLALAVRMHEVVREHGPACLAAGADLLVVSVGVVLASLAIARAERKRAQDMAAAARGS